MPERSEPSIMLTHSSRDWPRRLHFHLVDHGGGLLAGYALSGEDAQRARPDALFVDDVCSFATPRLVADLAARSVSVIGIYDPADGDAGVRRLQDLGVASLVSSEASVEAMLAEVRPGREAVSARLPVGPDAGQPQRRGKVVAVAAAAPGAGATEVAAAVAWAASARLPVVLADADENTPSVAARLGLPAHPNLMTASRSLQENAPLDGMLVHGARRNLKVLAGSRRTAERHVPAPDATGVLERLARRNHVVANCGAMIEDLQPVGAPPRFGLTRAVLADAEAVVLVSMAGPVGILRLADWLEGGSDLVERERLHIVMNRFPGGGFRSDELLRELHRIVDAASIRVLPHDSRVDHAAWRGRHVRRGTFARRARGLARELFPARRWS